MDSKADFDHLDDEASAFDLLRDLERQTPEEIRRKRSSDRIEVKAEVVIQSGDSSRMCKGAVQAVTGDLSEGGCRIMSPVPLGVGDVYRLMFDREALDLSLTFARCVRCRLVREDAFEVGFLFFNPIHLSDVLKVEAVGDGLPAEPAGSSSLI